ncbi:MAG: hypothetical protein ACFB15_07360 [Cyclobacteriaceae bacterium]
MKFTFSLLLLLGSITMVYGQQPTKSWQRCQCTVERISGDREQGTLKVTITPQSLARTVSTFDGNAFSTDNADFTVFREFTFERKLVYPYLYLTYGQQIYSLDMENEQFYALRTVIGRARNATEAFEILTTQVLLPQKCQQATVIFKTTLTPTVQMPLPLLPGSWYN